MLRVQQLACRLVLLARAFESAHGDEEEVEHVKRIGRLEKLLVPLVDGAESGCALLDLGRRAALSLGAEERAEHA